MSRTANKILEDWKKSHVTRTIVNLLDADTELRDWYDAGYSQIMVDFDNSIGRVKVILIPDKLHHEPSDSDFEKIQARFVQWWYDK
jgi:hypothetical protein